MKMRENYLELAERARRRIREGKTDTGVPEIQESHDEVVSRIRGGQRRPR